MGKIYYIADCHLFHENVIKFDNRPFNNVEEMNRTIINNWNNRVRNNDTVYILGDFIWKSTYIWPEIVKSLNGKKILILGNHDPKVYSREVEECFEEIVGYKEISDCNKRIIMCHYPIIFHNKDHVENCYMLYGHVHITKEYQYLKEIRKDIKKRIDKETASPLGNFINVGCMMPWINYTPRTIEEIVAGDEEYLGEDKCIT